MPYLLAVAFILSAMLKLHGVISFTPSAWPAQLQLILVSFELGMACWLCSGSRMRRAAKICALFFLVGCCYNAWLLYLKRPSCGCFGVVEISPAYTLLIDAFLFLCSMTGVFFAPNKRRTANSWWGNLAFASAILCTCLLALFTFSAQPEVAIQTLRGDKMLIYPALTDVGTDKVGTVKSFQVTVVNTTDKPIKLIGGEVICGCYTFANLPTTIEPGQLKQLNVTAVRKSAGEFNRRFSFYADGVGKVFAGFTGHNTPKE